jgi:hypothetical protein
MKKILYLMIIFGILFGYSCSQTRTCPAFPDKYLSRIPYENIDELKFSNLEDTIKLKIKKFEKTAQYEVSKKIDIACHAQANFITEKEQKTALILSGYCEKFENTDDIQIQYSFDIADNRDDFIFRITNGEVSYATQIIENLIINNEEYENVIYLEKDTTNNNVRIKDLYIANNIGIIKFVQRDNTEWILTNE